RNPNGCLEARSTRAMKFPRAVENLKRRNAGKCILATLLAASSSAPGINCTVAGFVFDFASFVVDALANRAANIDLFFGGLVIGRFSGIVLDYRCGGLWWRHGCLHCAA
ncbi:MAG: hypothetical protein ABSH40_19620, partial [Bryobacteraceae bacterium]